MSGKRSEPSFRLARRERQLSVKGPHVDCRGKVPVGYIGPNQAGGLSARLGSAAKSGTAAAATATFTLALNGTAIGTIAWAAGKTTPTFTTTGGNAFLVNAGDVLTLTLRCPSAA